VKPGSVLPTLGNLEPTAAVAEQLPGQRNGALCLIVSTDRGVSTVPLKAGSTLTLGRAPEAEVVVDDPSVSRQHARLTVSARVTLTDLGSRNGTRVDGEPIAPHIETPLRVGASFELGSTTLVLQRTQGLFASDTAARSTGSFNVLAPPSSNAVVRDGAMLRLYSMLKVVAPSPLSILILGETGVGKEVFAETAHGLSHRADRPFLRLNCAALPGSLLEGELFGYEKGAFTGAMQAKPGLFEAADGGTVFLDEIGEVPLETQAKMLRVLESGEVLRLGSVRPKHVDVRFIAATNRDLRALIVEGRFRSDLYFRLNGISITVPPLRERRDDIVPLAEHFLRRLSERMGRKAPLLSPEAAIVLQRQAWPGNVRELRNAVERALVMCAGPVIEPEHLMTPEEVLTPAPGATPPASRGASTPPTARPETTVGSAAASGDGEGSPGLKAQMEAFERQAILDALDKTAGNQSRAAKLLGITRRLLILRIEQYGIPRPRGKAAK